MAGRRVCRGILAALLLSSLFPGSYAFAQEQTGILQGRVVDESGGALPGVTVTVSGATILGGSRAATTSETGNYRLQNVPLGTYTVTFELSGFERVQRTVGLAPTQDLPLAVERRTLQDHFARGPLNRGDGDDACGETLTTEWIQALLHLGQVVQAIPVGVGPL